MELFEEKKQVVPGAGRIGMTLFLLALSMLFGASIVGYLLIRARAVQWPPQGMPHLPGGLWISTLVILIGAWAMESAWRALLGGRQRAFRRGLVLATILGFGFLIAQAINWSALAAEFRSKNLYIFTFYLLTGLHALHVVGGLIPLVLVTVRASRGRYDAERSNGVRYTRMYWHFLTAIWLVLFLLLQVGS